MDVKKGKLLYDGGTKKLYPTDRENHLVMHFKNDAPDGKYAAVKSRGACNASVSATLFKFLESYHIPTHFVRALKQDEILIKSCKAIPIRVVLWNIATDELTKRFGVKKGTLLNCTILEYHLKDEKHRNPMISVDHACAFGLASPDEMEFIDRNARKINAVLKSYFERRAFKLGRVELEFGRYGDQILLIDDLYLDVCQLWDLNSDEKQPIDPLHSADAHQAYQALMNRLA